MSQVDEDESGDSPKANMADDASDTETSGSESGNPVEWLATGREKRSTAGNRMTTLVQAEGEDDELELLFAEDEDDVGFEGSADDQSDVQMDSSDDDDDKGPQGDAEEEFEGEKELRKADRAEQLAKRRKAVVPKLGKKVRIDPMAPKAAPSRPKKKSERASWLPTAEDAPTRASSRRTTKQSKEQLLVQMADREEKRLKQLENMEKAARRKEASKPKAMTQADRLAEAARIEKQNAKSLNRWEEAEKAREEEQRQRLAALSNRQLKGPAITWLSGIGEWEDGKLRRVGKFTLMGITEKEVVKEKVVRKRKYADISTAKGKKGQKDVEMIVVSREKGSKAPGSGSMTTALANEMVSEPPTSHAKPESKPEMPSEVKLGINTPRITLNDQPLNDDSIEAEKQNERLPVATESVASKAENKIGDVTQETKSPPRTDPHTAMLDDSAPSSGFLEEIEYNAALPVQCTQSDAMTLTRSEDEARKDSKEEVQTEQQPSTQEDSQEPIIQIPSKSDPLVFSTKQFNPPALSTEQQQTQSLHEKHSKQQDETSAVIEPSTQPPSTPGSHTESGQVMTKDSQQENERSIKLMTVSDVSTESSSKTQEPHHSEGQHQDNLEPPPRPHLLEKGTQNYLILQNFNEAHIKQKEVQSHIIFGRKIPQKTPKPVSLDFCVITNMPAKYRDPATGLPYSNAYAYKEIQKLKRGQYRWSDLVEAYLGEEHGALGVPERFKGIKVGSALEGGAAKG